MKAIQETFLFSALRLGILTFMLTRIVQKYTAIYCTLHDSGKSLITHNGVTITLYYGVTLTPDLVLLLHYKRCHTDTRFGVTVTL